VGNFVLPLPDAFATTVDVSAYAPNIATTYLILAYDANQTQTSAAMLVSPDGGISFNSGIGPTAPDTIIPTFVSWNLCTSGNT
jgi:hypothetical protein